MIHGLLDEEEVESFCPLTPDELIELASTGETNSRLIREEGGAAPWELSYGPFEPQELPSQRGRRWTLLVQQVDRLEPCVAQLRERFAFVPRWRLEDIMVSYAPLGGSVGAHVDNYDVFLVQGRGRRRWEVEARTRPVEQEGLVPGIGVRVLSHFSPDFSHELTPGDALYLPPRYAHHGVSTRADCMTYSVGFKAPSIAELLTSFADHAARRLPEDRRYVDAGVGVVREGQGGGIDAATVGRLRSLLGEALEEAMQDDSLVAGWAGSVLTTRSCGEVRAARADGGGARGDDEVVAGEVRAHEGGAGGGEVEVVVTGETDEVMWTGREHGEDEEEQEEIDEYNGADFSDPLSPRQVVQAIRNGSADVSCLRHAEGSVIAFVAGSTEGAHNITKNDAANTNDINRLFIDGTELPVENDAAKYLPIICASNQIPAEHLRLPLQNSEALADLLVRLLELDVLWLDLEI